MIDLYDDLVDYVKEALATMREWEIEDGPAE
jgi:hypothetical protein